MTYRTRESIEQAFYLLIDGIPHAWFTRADAAASVTLSGYTKHVGLRDPSYEYGIDIREGWYTSSTTTLTIDDVDEQLVALFASSPTSEADLTQNILASTDASALTEVHGNYVGLERFGASGERHQYPWHPNDTVGHEHLSVNAATQLGVAAARITDTAVIFSGRRFGIYRTIRKDDGTWLPHPVASPVSGTEYAELRYWGTMRDSGQVRGRTWSLSVGGPESLLQRTLGQQVLREPIVAIPRMTITGDELHVGVGMAMGSSGYYANEKVIRVAGDGAYIWPIQFRTAAGSSESQIVSAVKLAMTDALDIDRNGTTPATSDGYGDISGLSYPGIEMLGTNAVYIRGLNTDNNIRYGMARIVMNEKAWALLGYNPLNDGDPSQGELDIDDPYYVSFKPYAPKEIDGVSIGPGYWIGTFIGATPNAETSSQVGVSGRVVLPFSPDGASIWGNDVSEPIDFDLRTLEASTWAIGQNDIPPVAEPTLPGGQNQFGAIVPATGYKIQDTATVGATRLALLSGIIRYAGSSEELEFSQVCRTSWPVSSDIGVEAVGVYPMGCVSAWLPPDLYGIDNRPMDRPWAVSDDENFAVRITWINSFSNARDGFGSQIHQVAQRCLLSTGTGTGWRVGTAQAYGSDGTLDRGDNDPSDGVPKDVEIGDLGLAIPHQLVASADEWKDAIEPLGPSLYNVIVATAGPIQADEMLRGMTQGLGMCWGLRGGKYGIFDPWQPTSTTTADVQIGQADMLRSGGVGSTSQDLRALAPIDKVTVQMREKITQPGSYVESFELRATDRGAKYRTSGADHSVTLPWHVPRSVSQGTLQARWDLGFVFWSKRHFIARAIKVGRLPGQDLYPGTRVLVTDPWMVAQSGAYGVTAAPALVLSVAVDHNSEEYTIDLLVYDEPSSSQRVLAPEARAVAYDSATYSIQCLPDFRGIGGTHQDLAGFVKPSWASGLTGDLAIQVRQGTRENPTKYDTLTGSVSAIDLVNNTIALTGALTGGTWRRDAIKIVTIRPYANQVEWARRVFYPIATEAGTVGGSAANAVILPE
jgi:hypothetical protein